MKRPVFVGLAGQDRRRLRWPVEPAGRRVGPRHRNTTDPSTPLENAGVITDKLARSRLLTVNGYGHTAILNPSACANDAIVAYVTRGKLPPKGLVCQQDAPPF
jgi:hypothetical protein